ncbi:MAG: SDR family NAD(P)-dependent oxidoreductase [Pseudomonadota bacterium]
MVQTGFTRRDALRYTGAGLAFAGLATRTNAQSASDRVALVTGCSSGFGELAAIELARAGFVTFATMRMVTAANAPAAVRLAEIADAETLPLTVIDLDARDQASVMAAVSLAEAAGPLDVVVNNAGYVLAGSIELHSEEDVRAQFETNIFGYHRLVRAALPGMRERGAGLIVQISSGLGRIVFPTQG